jgi:tryptophan synthase beta subunit
MSDGHRSDTASIQALETSHAVWATVELAKTMPKEANIVMCLSGRGDKVCMHVSAFPALRLTHLLIGRRANRRGSPQMG